MSGMCAWREARGRGREGGGTLGVYVRGRVEWRVEGGRRCRGGDGPPPGHAACGNARRVSESRPTACYRGTWGVSLRTPRARNPVFRRRACKKPQVFCTLGLGGVSGFHMRVLPGFDGVRRWTTDRLGESQPVTTRSDETGTQVAWGLSMPMSLESRRPALLPVPHSATLVPSRSQHGAGVGWGEVVG